MEFLVQAKWNETGLRCCCPCTVAGHDVSQNFSEVGGGLYSIRHAVQPGRSGVVAEALPHVLTLWDPGIAQCQCCWACCSKATRVVSFVPTRSLCVYSCQCVHAHVHVHAYGHAYGHVLRNVCVCCRGPLTPVANTSSWNSVALSPSAITVAGEAPDIVINGGVGCDVPGAAFGFDTIALCTLCLYTPLVGGPKVSTQCAVDYRCVVVLLVLLNPCNTFHHRILSLLGPVP